MLRAGALLALLLVACAGESEGASALDLLPTPLPVAVFVPQATWRLEPAHTTADLYGVWGSGPGDVYVVGTSGTILHTPGWRMTHVMEASFLDVVWGTGPTEVYVGSIVPGRGASAPIFRSTDAGGTWPVASGAGRNSITALWGTGALDVWIGVASNDGDLIHSSDRLATVQSWGQAMGPLVQVRGVTGDAGGVLVLRSDGMVMRSTGRTTWTSASVPVGAPRAIAMAGSQVWVVGDGIAHSSDRGITWSVASSGTALKAVHAVSASELFVVGAGGAVLHSSDGQSFVRETVPTSADLHGVWASGPRDVYAVGAGGTILHFSR